MPRFLSKILSAHLLLRANEFANPFRQARFLIKILIERCDKVCSRFSLENLFEGTHRRDRAFAEGVKTLQFFLPVLLQSLDKWPFPHAPADAVLDDIVFQVGHLVRCQIAESGFEDAQYRIRPVFFDDHADLRGDVAHDRTLQDIAAGVRNQINSVFAEDPPQNRSALLLIVADELNFVVMISQIPHQMQNINRCALGFVVQIRRGHQTQPLAGIEIFGRSCGQGVKLLFDLSNRRGTIPNPVAFRYCLPFAVDAARLRSLLQFVHDELRQRKQLAISAAPIMVRGQHHLNLARAAHQFPDDRHRLWRETVKAIDPDILILNQRGLRDLTQKKIDIVL